MSVEKDDGIRIVMADDHPVYRLGLRQVIEADTRLKIVAEAADGEGALEMVRRVRPEVAILDVQMPRRDGYEVAREIRAERLATAVIFLTQYRDAQSLNAALDLGARGYVLKESSFVEIVESIRIVAAGGHFISPALSTHMVERQRRAEALTAHHPGLSTLSPTERRIVKLIAEYRTSRQIADELCIGVRTVEHHRARIGEKLGLKGSHTLLRFAVEHQSEL